MEFNIYTIAFGIVGIVLGLIVSKILDKSSANKTITNAQKEASQLIRDAQKEGEIIKKDKLFQAKEKFLELKSEHDKVITSRENKLNDANFKEFKLESKTVEFKVIKNEKCFCDENYKRFI